MTARPPTIERPTEREAPEPPEPPEVLFREARRRRRRRWVLGSTVVVVAAAIAIAFGVGTNGPGRRPHPSSTPTTPPPSGTATTVPKATLASLPVGPARITYTTGVSFLDATDGYAIFRTGPYGVTSQKTCGRLFVGKTTDGGGQFSSVAELPGCAADAITFDDRGDGFVYGPGLYVTHDGGRTWAVQKEPGNVLSVRPVGSSLWMLLSKCPEGQPKTSHLEHCPVAFLTSSDGGKVWHPQRFPATALMSTSGRGAPQSMVRIGASTGYVVSTPVQQFQPPTTTTSGSVPLWFTSDGGESWVKRAIPCGTLGNVATPQERTPGRAVVSASPTGALFAICGYAYPGQDNWSQYWTVLTSADGGVRWSKVASHVFGGHLGKLDAVSATTAFELGFHGALMKTTDAGATWLPSKTVGVVTSPYALQFFTPTDGVVLDETALWHTTDGGASWTQGVPTVVATSAPACTASQLQVGQGRGVRADGHVLDVVLLTNTGAVCTLSGWPLLLGTSPSGRRSLPVGYYTWFGTLVPTVLSRGEQGQLWLQTTTTCGRSTRGRVDDVVLDLPGRGGTVDLTWFSYTLACGISESQLGIPRKPAAPRGSVAGLKVVLSGIPTTVLAGSVVHYTVTLYNLTSVIVKMMPCPRYTVVFHTAIGTSKREQVLASDTSPFACRTVGSIPPGGTAQVSLSVRAPKVSHISTAGLIWKFDVAGVATTPTSTSTTGVVASGMKILTARAAAQNGVN